MKKVILLLMGLALLIVGCSSSAGDKHSQENNSFLNQTTSYFDNYENEQTDTVYKISGQVHQEGDENAIATTLHAEKDTKIKVTGTLTWVSGGGTELVCTGSDGTETKIADNSQETFDTTIDIPKGDGQVKFKGGTAVYDFTIQLELTDDITYSNHL